MKIFKRLFSIFLSFVLIITFAACGKESLNANDNFHAVTKLFDQVMDAGTYTELDYDGAQEICAVNYDSWGGCTAVAKTLANGDTIVGRNMDLTISNKCAYVMRTAVEGCYETIQLAYTYRYYSPEYKDVLKNGISDDFYKILPFMSDDALNSEGLYIELNMRNAECWPDGSEKFSCKGTNPDSDTRVYMFSIPTYVATHCATVDEALEYIASLDVYAKEGFWDYCFLIADATGHYGVLEFAHNNMYWNEGQAAQANFYINEKLQSVSEYRTGEGRYDYVMSHIDSVSNEQEMFDLMDDVKYSQAYNYKTSKFDVRSEFVSVRPYWTNDYVLNEANSAEMNVYMELASLVFNNLSRREKQEYCVFWESTFTEVVNCNEKTIHVRFFENDDKVLDLSFD